MHHLHPTHLQPLDCRHIDLGHIVLSIARIDVLSDSLRLVHDKFLTFVDGKFMIFQAIVWLLRNFLLVVTEPGIHVL